jgi:hypothetical protein
MLPKKLSYRFIDLRVPEQIFEGLRRKPPAPIAAEPGAKEQTVSRRYCQVHLD